MFPSRAYLWLIGTLALVIGAVPVAVAAAAETSIRPAVWAGSFYPVDAGKLTAMIAELAARAGSAPVDPPPGKPLRAVVFPHAGYVYSGWTAAHAARVIPRDRFTRVLLVGPDHRVGLRKGAVSDVAAYETPLGTVAVDPAAHRLRETPDLFTASPASDRREHSLEVILPFLQQRLGRFSLVPVVLGAVDPGRVADKLTPLLDDRTLLAVSSDLSHYLPYDAAVARDRRTLRAILDLDAPALTAGANVACGVYPLATLIELARRHDWQPVLLHRSNSGDTAGGRDRVVGYAALAFYGDRPMDAEPRDRSTLTEPQGQTLVRLARHTIREKLAGAPDPEQARELERLLAQDAFQARGGTFVTLKIDGRLRGCIGNLTASETLAEGIRRNARNAAFSDFRFRPLTPGELERVRIEVSVLTEPRPFEYTDGDDLAARLRPGVDGVILGRGGRRATFLPQVWDQLPRPADFLSHLCAKAGLPEDAWRTAPLDVSTYQVTYFEEPR